MNLKIVRVLQVGMTKNIGGMETYLMSQYRNLNFNKVRYDFINLNGEYPIAFEKEIKENSKIFSVLGRRTHPIRHYWQIAKIIFKNRNQYRYIVLNTCHLYYIFPLFFAKIVGIPHRIIHSHNSGDEVKIGFFRNLLIIVNRFLMR